MLSRIRKLTFNIQVTIYQNLCRLNGSLNIERHCYQYCPMLPYKIRCGIWPWSTFTSSSLHNDVYVRYVYA